MSAPSSSAVNNPVLIAKLASLPLVLTVRQAAAVTGYKLSTLEKAFMKNPPSYAPPAPPHERDGRAIRIITHELPRWLDEVRNGKKAEVVELPKRSPGRPTKAAAAAYREAEMRIAAMKAA